MLSNRTFWFSFFAIFSLWLCFAVSITYLNQVVSDTLHKNVIANIHSIIENTVEVIRETKHNSKSHFQSTDERENGLRKINDINPSLNNLAQTKYQDITGDLILWGIHKVGIEESDGYCIAIKNNQGEMIFDTFSNYYPIRNYSSFDQFTAYKYQHNPLLPPENVPEYCLLTEQKLFKNGEFAIGVDFGFQYTLIEHITFITHLTLIISGLIVLVLSVIIGGYSRKRLTPINTLCQKVQKGELQTRLPITSVKDDFDQLTVNINTMLNQLAKHVASVRHISDNIAHDLRTPVTRLRGQLDLLLGMDKKDDTLIEAVIEESDLLISIFNALLRIAQLESQTFEDEFKPIKIEAILLDAIDLYDPMFERKNILVKMDIGENLNIKGDSDLWIQVFSNLLDNSLKYSDENSDLIINANKTKHFVTVSIKDSGKGIPRTEHERVFQRFYRLSKHRTTHGSGLGLSLVAAVCHRHNATIQLKNDHGLLVEIQIPREQVLST